jgi:hypothetical protein
MLMSDEKLCERDVTGTLSCSTVAGSASFTATRRDLSTCSDTTGSFAEQYDLAVVSCADRHAEESIMAGPSSISDERAGYKRAVSSVTSLP